MMGCSLPLILPERGEESKLVGGGPLLVTGLYLPRGVMPRENPCDMEDEGEQESSRVPDTVPVKLHDGSFP
jgi:hypothetical protein